MDTWPRQVDDFAVQEKMTIKGTHIVRTFVLALMLLTACNNQPEPTPVASPLKL